MSCSLIWVVGVAPGKALLLSGVQAPNTLIVMPSRARAMEVSPVFSVIDMLKARPFSDPWRRICPSFRSSLAIGERRCSMLAAGVLSVIFFRSIWMKDGMFHSQGGPVSQLPSA